MNKKILIVVISIALVAAAGGLFFIWRPAGEKTADGKDNRPLLSGNEKTALKVTAAPTNNNTKTQPESDGTKTTMESAQTSAQNVTPEPGTATQTQNVAIETTAGIMIDFAACQPQKHRIYLDFGSTTYEIKGRAGDTCEMSYGGEVEDPKWDGKLTTTCKVPVSSGRLDFKKTKYGVDFSPIKQNCVQN